MFAETELELLEKIVRQGLPGALGETLLMTFVPTILAFALGLPLGVLLVIGEPGGVRPLPRWLMRTLNALINVLRSVPFLILLIVVLPLSRLLVGTTVGTKAILAPLVIAAFPFVARLVETSIREVDAGVVEAAQSMGASPFQIVWKVLIPEATHGGARTSFLSVTGDLDELNRIHETLEAALFEYGFAGGKVRFTPHITLARAVELNGDISRVHVPNAGFTVRSIVLFESTNENGRMVYTPVHTETF